jgi:pilus assembly protein Flp/PilA
VPLRAVSRMGRSTHVTTSDKPYYQTMINRTADLYLRTRTSIRTVLDREHGASMVEYALLVALIAMIAIVAVALVGTALQDQYQDIAQSVVDS